MPKTLYICPNAHNLKANWGKYESELLLTGLSLRVRMNILAGLSYLSTLCDVLTLLWSEESNGIKVFLLTWIFKSRAIFAKKQKTISVGVIASGLPFI